MAIDRQFPSDAETDRLIALLNLIRRQAGLPLVEHSEELDRVRKVQQQRAFEQWMQLRRRIAAKLLARVRRRIGRPDWGPDGFISGGGLAFHIALVKHMRKLKGRLDEPALR